MQQFCAGGVQQWTFLPQSGIPDRSEHRQAAKRAAADLEGHSATAKYRQPG
jgi:hypothetical protein